MPKTVGVAVSNATFHFDKLYTYAVLPEHQDKVRLGSMVLVPFGRGSRARMGVVLACDAEPEHSKLKFLFDVAPASACLTPELLRLVHFLKERTFCTYYEAVKAVIPYGAQYKPTVAADGVTPVLQKQLVRHTENSYRLVGTLPQKPKPTAKQLAAVALLGGGPRTLTELEEKGISRAVLDNLCTKGVLECTKVNKSIDLYASIPLQNEPIVLTQEQQTAYDALLPKLEDAAPHSALLYGVTGSGKTQVYLQLIAHALEQGKSAIVLVPEIGLTPQLLRQFAARFGEEVAVLHSALSAGERYDSFKKIKTGRARVVIGTRSAVFAPAKNLGVIIIDEEQDAAYRSEQSPRYHARDVAKYRAAQTNALLVLGSATPSVETYYGAKQGKYPVFALTERFLGAGLPEVIISDMRGLAREGRSGIIGPDLERELIGTLEKGKQAILFLNRRGNSRVIGCGVCGWVPECPSCSTTMTYHSVSGRAMCHYCGASIKITGKCPQCGSTSLFTETPGTQKLEEELHERFPSARVLRMDADTMTAKGAHERLLNKFGKGEADILIGTQMVTKGLDFENVTLVGVLDADQSLYAQDYRAHERTFSLITQVVGRAGRRFDTGRAVIQTYSPLHPVILTAARQDYEAFYESEMQTREALRCPPVCDITMITAVGELEQQVLSSLLALKTRLQSLMEGQFADVKAPVLGPAAAQMVKVMGRYRYHLTIRAKDCARWRRLISGVLREFMQDGKNRGVTVFADSNNEM